MNRLTRITLITLFSGALIAAAGGCRRTDNGNPGALDAGSSGVMSNSAGPSGTPGESDAAKRADSSAGAAASETTAASSVAPVVSTPSSSASATNQ
jgi:hypothetical protein